MQKNLMESFESILSRTPYDKINSVISLMNANGLGYMVDSVKNIKEFTFICPVSGLPVYTLCYGECTHWINNEDTLNCILHPNASFSNEVLNNALLKIRKQLGIIVKTKKEKVKEEGVYFSEEENPLFEFFMYCVYL